MLKRTIAYEITTEYKGIKVSRFLKEMGYPEKILTILRKVDGNLTINGKNIHMNYELLTSNSKETLVIHIYEEESSENIVPVNIPIDIIYEDEDILVINKPASMPIHPSLNNYDNTLANAVAYYFMMKDEPFIFRCINRLDKDTTGLTVLAKHYLAAGILSQNMQTRNIKREYTAIVEGHFDKEYGRIDFPIGRENASLITRTIDFKHGETAITNYQVLDYIERKNLSLVKLNLETGRTHQIRVHMKAIGHPLVGDYLYNPDSKLLNRQALHAGYIEFCHPITKEIISLSAPFPDDFLSIVSNETSP